MDPYTSERLLLERHDAVVRAAELRSRLVPEADRTAGFNTWIAGRLRGLADRLDGHRNFEKVGQ